MFKRDQSGSVALLFALMLPALMVGIGGGIEVSRAVEYKQRLTSATDLACRQAEVWVEDTQAANQTKDYTNDVKAYGTKNRDERDLTATATITATPTKSATLLGLVGVKPGNIHVVGTGSLDLVFKNFLSKGSLSFTVVRDCTVNASSSTGTPTLILSESFEGNTSKLNGGWRVFADTLAVENCQTGSLCSGKSWGMGGAGLEVNELSGLTGDGVVYGQAFAELDSDCSNQNTTTTASRSACSAGNTNSSLSMTMNLEPGTYEVRYNYVARKGVPVGSTGLPRIPSTNNFVYEYPNDPVICSKASDTTYNARNTSVATTASGTTTTSLDKQTRRIEMYVEPKSSGYDFDQVNMVDVCVWATAWTDRSYKFNVTNKSDYRISWRAAGNDDSFGGLIDYLRICRNSCP